MKKKQPTPEEIEAIAKLAWKLNENPNDRAALSRAAELISEGQGDILLKALLHPRWDELDGDIGAKEVAAITATNRLLETMMAASPGVAGYLMLKLSPLAGRYYMNHISDGIDLYISASASEELADSLMLLANENAGPRRRRYYEALAANIRENIKRATPGAEKGSRHHQPSFLLHRPDQVDFLENVASEERMRAHVLSLAGGRQGIADRFIFHHHVYEAEPATDEQTVIKAYLTSLGYHPEAREQQAPTSGQEPLAELDVEVAYTLLGEAFGRALDGAGEPATEAEIQGFVQRVREETQAWTVLAFTNREIPPQRQSGLLAGSFHRVVSDLSDEAGVILVGEQDIAMIWFLDGASPPPSR